MRLSNSWKELSKNRQAAENSFWDKGSPAPRVRRLVFIMFNSPSQKDGAWVTVRRSGVTALV